MLSLINAMEKKLIRAGNLIKQGKCKKCNIPIFGYSEKRKF